MVDTKPAMESNLISVELVEQSPTKILVPLAGGGYEDVQYNEREPPVKKLTLPVEIDGKRKLWRPGKETIQNLQVYGSDSNNWVGKPVRLQIVFMKSRKYVIGFPANMPFPPQKIPDSQIPSYAKGPGVEFSKGSFTAPPGHDDSGQF